MRFATEQGLKNYVDNELGKALLSGWVANFRIQYRNLGKAAQDIKLRHMEWKIAPEQEGGVLSQDYLLRVTSDLSTFIVIHGNSDAGAYNMHHVLLNAQVIYADDLDYFPLSEIIYYVVRNYKPNTWGLS